MEYGFYLEKDRVFPAIVQISITNLCDMECNMCPHSDLIKQDYFKPQYLDLELYKQIAHEVGENKGTIRLLGWGEALIHPDLIEMVRFAKQEGVEFVNLITNGKQLTKEKSIGLIEAGLDILEVSLDAYNESTYRAIRNNPHFKNIKKNIFNFIELRNRIKSNTYITLGIINQPKIEAELNEFKKYWLQFVDDIVVRRYRDFKGHIKDFIEIPNKREPCRCLWARFNITPEGKVTVCYDDWQSKYIVADLNDKDATISKILQEIVDKVDEK